MQSFISTSTPKTQQINQEWYGATIVPPYEYSFTLTPEGLEFYASRKAAATVHPDGVCGAFQAELWRYDAAEFFITTPDGKRYMEFNLSPNGAWWAAVFCAPRQIAPGFENWEPAGIQATGDSTKEVYIGSDSTGWFSDYSYFVRSSDPFFARSGHCSDGSGAGVE
ncbi:MAG: hypothetical protein II295_06125, partial [Akkermansia sp.]|nr:hypothetical protein [Akkermansia sp.]